MVTIFFLIFLCRPIYGEQHIDECNDQQVNLPKIRVLGDPILSKSARQVTKDEIISSPIIHEAMKAGHLALADFRQKHGYGRAIAAPQFGYSIQMICMNLGAPITMFNPEIIDKSVETFLMWDDCLSFPDFMACVKRHTSISIRFQDSSGEIQYWNNLPRDTSELLQHEIDHLHGILAIDIATQPSNCVDSDIDCKAIISRSDWLANRDKYDQLL